MRKLAVMLVPWNLTEEQKDRHFALCLDFVEQLQEDNFLDVVITGDETWYYHYDSEAKCQYINSRSENSSWPNKSWMSKSKINTMLVCFFNIRGIIHFEFIS
jgi:hypothetical protein